MAVKLNALVGIVVAVLSVGLRVQATETENLDLKVLPAPGKVTVDGKFDDWDLSGGIFACSDVENQRDKYGVWVYTMWDADNLYILARWNDLTPDEQPRQHQGRQRL